MEVQSNNLFITYVEKEGPFLKVWGQTDKNTALYVEQVLHSFTNQFDNGLCTPHPETLQIGILCCAKYKDNKYYRARVTSLNYLHNRYVEVNFLDYGNKDVVPVSSIRSLEGFDNSFLSIPAQAHCFLLAEAVCPRGEWNDEYLNEICKEVKYSEVNFTVVAQVTKHYLVRLFVGSSDVAVILISKGLMRHTSLTTQEAVLLSMMPRVVSNQLQPGTITQPSIATYKAFTLEPGNQYEVYVSYVTDGPCNFSVQLKQSEEVLAKLMKEINSMNLTPLESVPLPGTVCLSRCQEDGHICRAVVTNEVDGNFKVFYVDFGNFEVVPFEALYEIPFKFVIPKVMAIRFALAGVEKATVTLDMQVAFKEFVDNRLIILKVIPTVARTALPRCELWDPDTHISALDILNQAAAASYPEHISLNRGFTQLVKVSYVSSCNKFYVQLKSKIEDLSKLMAEMQIICQRSDPVSFDSLRVGLPCYALFPSDEQWYRSQIVESLADGQIKIQYVDYGNEEIVHFSTLRNIEGKQLTVLRPQAIECSLNGYQNMEPDLERDNLLEELILEQEFTMKVIEMQGKKALIELIDSNNYNVASLLLDKIASTHSQAGPILVQAGNKIEHRKSTPREQPFNKRQDLRKPDRMKTQWDSNSSWRQNSKGYRGRNNSDDDTVNENSSWRQNQKGFNRNFDKNKRDELSDSTESETRFSNKGFNRTNDRNWNNIDTRGGGEGRNFNRGRSRDTRNSDRGGEDYEKKSFNHREQDSWGSGASDPRFENSPENDDSWGGNDKNRKGRRQNDEWTSERKTSNFRQKDDRNERKAFSPKTFSPEAESSWSDKKHFSPRDDDSREYKRGGRSRDEWDNKDDAQEKTFFKKSFTPRDRAANFPRNKQRFNEENDTGHSETFRKPGGFRQKADYKREGSEFSSSGSEKSFKKGFKDNRPRGAKFNKPPRSDFDQNSKQNSWNAASKQDSWNAAPEQDSWDAGPSVTQIPDAAPVTAQFEQLNVNQTEASVTISWFHNPAHFYCLIENTQDEFKNMMQDIQEAYKDRQSSTAEVGQPVIALFLEDNVLYRAQVLEILGSQFKVLYVDFGNVSVVDKVWPIEMRFMSLPSQAICCKLDGIKPSSENWLDATSYAQYFSKKEFQCQFLGKDNNRVSVKLFSDGEDICDLLLRDGLAKSLEPPKPVELPLLIGQQFRAALLSVNSLSDFIMRLNSTVILNCSVFNLENATEKFETTLREKLEQVLIVYVDDLVEDRLQVTLYDSDGSKIKLIDKDEEAYEFVDLLCPYLILYSTLSGFVSHIEENSVFLQPSDCSESLDHLLNTIYETYENSTLESPIVPVEGHVYAVKGSDLNWYRAKVISVEENAAVINYVDYGNSESVEFTNFREITREFMEIPTICVQLTVQIPNENLLNKSVSAALTFTENGIEAIIQEETVQEQIVEPVQVVSSETEPFVDSEIVPLVDSEPVPVVDSEPVPVVDSEPVPKEPSPVKGTHVILSHSDSPSDFYLQLAESVTAVEELQALLQDQINGMPDLENPTVGVLCAAPYSVDQQWYRAHVLDADSDITTVRFVDFGNTDVINNNTTRIKTLPPDLLTMEVHTTRCTLKIKPVEEEWSAAASERFEHLCDTDYLTAEFLHQDEKTNYVDLYCGGANISEILINENLALPDEVMPESKSICFVSHLNSPSEFWIQLESCVDELEWVAEQLSGAENFQELEDLTPGTLCAALFPDDQMWYRARILSNTVAGIEVLFVDYGNSCTSCSLRELPEDLVMLPPLAQKCSLKKPENLTNWGPEMIKKFSEISAEGQTTFAVKKLSTGETALVELLFDGVDITTMLLPKTEDVQVKSFDGLDKLVLVKGGQEIEGSYQLESLPDVVWLDESYKKFAEMINEGKTVFQAEFVSGNVVRLYHGVNDVRLDLSGTKTSTPTSSPLKMRSHSIEGNACADVAAILDDVVDRSTNFHSELAGSVVTDIVNRSVNSSSIIKPILDEIVEESSGFSQKISQSIIDDILNNAVVNKDLSEDHYQISQSIVGDVLSNAVLNKDSTEEDVKSCVNSDIEIQSAEISVSKDHKFEEKIPEVETIEGTVKLNSGYDATSENISKFKEQSLKEEIAEKDSEKSISGEVASSEDLSEPEEEIVKKETVQKSEVEVKTSGKDNKKCNSGNEIVESILNDIVTSKVIPDLSVSEVDVLPLQESSTSNEDNKIVSGNNSVDNANKRVELEKSEDSSKDSEHCDTVLLAEKSSGKNSSTGGSNDGN